MASWLLTLELILLLEAGRIQERLLTRGSTGGWLNDPDPDATFLLPLLVLAPFCWLFPFDWTRRSRAAHVTRPAHVPPVATAPRTDEIPRRHPLRVVRGLLSRALRCGQEKRVRNAVLAVMVAATSLTVSIRTAAFPRRGGAQPQTFGQSLPAIHDEFSYRLQAETLLAGRWWWPGPSRAPELFHQMHVLNEGRFASRYFPGTGLWLAPFVALGHPVWGARVAGMLAAVLVYFVGCRLDHAGTGLLAGLLTAVAPGMALFSNLLLSHGPTLVGLGVFLLSFFVLMDAVNFRVALWAGCGLSWAMLCRPLTAAAVGLPFGAWYVVQMVRATRGIVPPPLRQWFVGAAGLAIPLLLGCVLLFVQDYAITGDGFTTPYARYTQLYTPRHAYGFGNASSSAAPRGPQVLQDYDQWAQNLTLTRAAQNLVRRLRGSFAWTLGIAPLMLAAVLFLLTFRDHSRRHQLLFLSIVSLHLLHLPYWLDGILHYHYVFESGPLWLLLFASLSWRLLGTAVRNGCYLFPVWWGVLLLVSVAVNLFPIARGSTVPRIGRGIAELTQATDRLDAFHAVLATAPIVRPALVLVRTSPRDLHVDYVHNRPPFDAEILIGRYLPELYDGHRLHQLFPERHLYVYNTESRVVIPLPGGEATPAQP